MPPFSASLPSPTLCLSRRAVIIKRFSHLYYITKRNGEKGRRGIQLGQNVQHLKSKKNKKKKRSPKKENLNYGKSIGKENITRPGAREERVVVPVPQKGGSQLG